MWFVIIGCVLLVASRLCLPMESPEKRKARALSLVPNFTPVVEHQQPDKALTLMLDPASDRFVLMKGLDELRVFDFEQLVSAETVSDGKSIEKTNRGSQAMGVAVGGALLGPVGMLIGGLSGSKRRHATVKQLSLKLYTNDVHFPVSEIVFFKNSAGLPVDSRPVKQAASQLDEWYAKFLTILHGQRKEHPEPLPVQPVASSAGFGRRRGLLSGN
ncbi:hypothetical protein [Novosphingobium sp. AP12]|uniref:hypothetical protein n=1 Tax=Novosphingobium sp. AP12 TaxID=1144305 RepID=UPI0002721541|nr:hypothetical protein [Novosphingobium sp. AP12]EJL22439.1 hypothetical protein PMI02_04671 [Novosphingobium sp. AP12]